MNHSENANSSSGGMILTTRDENRAAGIDGRPPRGYMERKLAALCVRPGCNTGPADDSNLCDAHRDEARDRVRRSLRESRAAEREAGRCAMGCGRTSETYRCPVCAIRTGRLPRRSANNGVNNSAESRTRKHADGRTRFHGQMRRGRQTNASLDAQDILDGIKAYQRALEGLAYYQSAEVQAMPRIQRADIARAYLACVEHGGRFGEEVLQRRKYREQLDKAAPGPLMESDG